MRACDEDVVSSLARVSTGVLSDVLYEMGFANQTVASELSSINGTANFAGPAVCISGCSDGDAAVRILGAPSMFDVDALVAPGSVVVVDTGDHRVGAAIGGLVAQAFKRAGAIGFVTDGGVRDRSEIADMNLPCVARFVTPRSAKGVWSVTALGKPISLPGQARDPVLISPGDVLCCDADGLVVVPLALSAAVLAYSAGVEKAESRILEEIRTGGNRRDAYARFDRFLHIRRSPTQIG